MCDVVKEVLQDASCPASAEKQSEMSGVGQSVSVFLCTASNPKTDDIGDGLDDDGVSLVATIDTQESSPSTIGEVQGACGKLGDPSILHVNPMEVESHRHEQQQQKRGFKTHENVEAVFPSWMSCALPAVVTAADMAPTLLASFLSYSDEMFATAEAAAAAQTKSLISQTQQTPKCDQKVPLVSETFDFIRLRLFPSGNFPLPHGGYTPDQKKRSSVALSWFLQHHCELSATVMSMGFSFLLGLEERNFSWKKAVEVPLMGLQLLATYAHTLTFRREGNTFDAFSPRDHLIIMAACLLACWKCADVDANVEVLIAILDTSFFLHHRVLNVREVLYLESVVLSLCGLHVEAPRWWKVAIEILGAAYGEEEEAIRDLIEKSHTCCSRTADTLSDLQCRYEARLEKLLLTSQRVLLFVMNVATVSEMDGTNMSGDGQGTSSNRLRELRGAVCCWIESNPLFGVALAVTSGAVGLDWAASHIGPTAEMRSIGMGIQSAISDADAAVQREMHGMVDVLREVLCLLLEQTHEGPLQRQ